MRTSGIMYSLHFRKSYSSIFIERFCNGSMSRIRIGKGLMQNSTKPNKHACSLSILLSLGAFFCPARIDKMDASRYTASQKPSYTLPDKDELRPEKSGTILII